MKPTSMERSTESMTVVGEGSKELLAGYSVNQQPALLGRYVHPWLRNDLLPVRLPYGPPHQPVVVDELGHGSSGGYTFNLEYLPASLRANDRVRAPQGLRHA